MTAKLLDGKAIAARVREKLRGETETFRAAAGRAPGLVVVLVGDNPASKLYVSSKARACEELGWFSEVHRLPENASQHDVESLLQTLNADERVDGILLQLPLPRHLNEDALLQVIDPAKDVDGFHPVNVGRLVLGLPGPVPCTPLGVQTILIEEGIPTAGARVVVIGRSNIVGKPMAQLLLQRGPGGDATVTVAHSRSANLPELVGAADIVIAAIGQPEFVRGEWIKPGAVVIDVGINRIDDPSAPKGYRVVGDVEFAAAAERASAITPVPGGVGPMTIAMLLRNTLTCAKARAFPGTPIA